jgi:hypothetical protein
MSDKLPDNPQKQLLKRIILVALLAAAFGYIEAAVVVYLREIFYPDGFDFPLAQFGVNIGPLWRRLLLTEMAREAATLVVILTGCWIAGRNKHQRFAYFMAIFAVWDISFYIWLKILVNWPASLTDWDILFLIPATWASPVLAPVLVSLALLVFALTVLYRSVSGPVIKVTRIEWLGFIAAGVIIVASFLIAGTHITEPDFRSWFFWWLFALGYAGGTACFVSAFFRSQTT